MSEVTLGAVDIVGGYPLHVIHDDEDGTVMLWQPDSAQAFTMDVDQGGLLAGLLQRAAPSGQPPAAGRCPQPGCTAGPASASGGLPPKWCTGKCQPTEAPAGERMAITPDGDIKPVAQFAADEKWWCDGEECCDGENCDGDHLKVPHVHPYTGPARPVDLLTGGEIPA